MRRIGKCFLTVAVMTSAQLVCAHGFNISETDSGAVPVSLTAASQSQKLDSAGTASIYPNLFWDTFPAANGPNSLFTEGSSVSTPRSSSGTYYPTNDGGAATSGPFGLYDSATFTVISPLLFSNGGPAVPAASGTLLSIVERYPGNAPNGVSNLTNHPGAATTEAGLVTITGASGSVPGFQFSLTDTHELAKDLTLGGSMQTGEYGFAYTVTVNYHNGPSLTTGPLVDVFALTDPALTGGNFATAPLATQDAATSAIYATAVPEPSTFVLSAVGLIAFAWYRRRSYWLVRTAQRLFARSTSPTRCAETV